MEKYIDFKAYENKLYAGETLDLLSQVLQSMLTIKSWFLISYVRGEQLDFSVKFL